MKIKNKNELRNMLQNICRYKNIISTSVPVPSKMMASKKKHLIQLDIVLASVYLLSFHTIKKNPENHRRDAHLIHFSKLSFLLELSFLQNVFHFLNSSSKFLIHLNRNIIK